MNMKRMSKWVVAVAAAVLGVAAAHAGDSAPFALDTRTGTRIARGTEPIAYSTEWNRGADVQVFVDDELLTAATAPATGVVGWNAAEAEIGSHTLTCVSGGVILTAEFVVQGVQVKEADPMKGSITLAWTDAEAGNGVTYSIYRGAGENRSEAELVAPNVTETTWTDENYWTAEPALKPLNYWVVANVPGEGEREYKPVQTRRRFGVFVGLSDYREDIDIDRYPQPTKDATELRRLFMEYGEMAATNAVLLTNSDASWAGVSNVIAQKAEVVQPGDLFVLYVATHGGYKDGTASLLFYDGGVSMNLVFKVLEKLNTGAVVIPIFMACHSGAFVDYAGGIPDKSEKKKFDETSEGFKKFVDAGLALCRANMPVLASCGGVESSRLSNIYSDFGDAFIHEGWQNGYADGALQGVGYGGGNGDGFVSFLELIRYANAFARGLSDAHRAHVQWSAEPMEYEWLLRDTFAGQVPMGGSRPGVPNAPAVVTATSGTFNSLIHIAWSGVGDASRYWVYTLKDGRNGNNDDDWECLYYLAQSTEVPHRGASRGKNYQYRVRAVNGAGASELSKMIAQGSRRSGTIWDWLSNDVADADRWVRGLLGLETNPVVDISVIVAAAESAFSISGVVALPEEIGSYAVTSVPDSAFENCGVLTGMVIPASVTNVGANAFAGCDELATLYVPAAWEGTDMLVGVGVPEGCEVVYYEQLPTFQRVTFDANGGTCELAEGVFVVGETYDELPVAAWTGHAFDGWWTARTGGTQVTAAEEVTPEGERTLYAHWKVTSWQTVTFDANGGKCGTKTKKFAVAETYSPLPTATRTGQALLGWFTAKSGGTKVTAASVVTTASKRTLYAHWTTKQTAKFDANGGACTTKSKTCTIGKAYGTLPAATLAGQAFTGWFSAKTGGSKVTASTKVTAVTPRTLYAHWTTKQKVTFDANGGKCGTKSAVRAIGGLYGDLPVPTRSGQAFTGWFTAKKGGSKVAATTKVNVAAARTLHAHWTTTQTAQFDANGGTCTTKSKTYTIGKTYGTLPTATLAGNGFVAWYTAKTGGSKVAASSKVTAVTPRTLYAHWTTKQKVTFDANGGKCGTKSVVRAIGGTYGDLPVPTRSGQAFTGWFTAKSGGSKVAASTKVTAAAARTLHAHWTTTQTVTFDANGGTCKTKSKNFTIAKKYGTLPTPTWKGRTFAGWFSAKTGGTKVTAASTATAVASRTLYAHWAEQTVTFDANGGTCETATAKYVRGGTYKPLPVATRQDFGFGGWWTAANGGTKVTEFTTVTSSGTRTLHAHWGEPGTKFAVCVGINKYKSGFTEDLDGCVNDATVFRRNLVTLGEWQEANTVLLLNANATKTAIRKAISNCAARAVAGDTFVYQHSSHGGQNDGTSVFICGYDSDYQDTELAADLRSFAAGVKVVVVVDACNSGGLFAGASAKAVRRSAPQFDLAGRVTALMDAERHTRRARGEPVAKSLSSSEIGWVTSAHWNEESMDGGYYDHPRWMTGNATTADTWDLIGGVFMTAATWGWWDGSCDTDAKAGDGDGCCDAYEFWKKGRDCAIRCGTIWDDPSMNFTPQCTNVTVLRSVELGVAGARPKSGLAGKSVRDEELGTRNAAGREFAIYSFSMDANGVATPRGGRETDGCAGTLEFVAVAGTTYELQWTAALGSEWTTVRRWVAERDGACEVALPATEESTGFFRLAAP